MQRNTLHYQPYQPTERPTVQNQLTDWRDVLAAAIIGLALAALALAYFDVLTN